MLQVVASQFFAVHPEFMPLITISVDFLSRMDDNGDINSLEVEKYEKENQFVVFFHGDAVFDDLFWCVRKCSRNR